MDKRDLCLWNQGSGGGGGGGSSTLSGLTDVDISNPTDGQTLVYNASAGKWENGAGGGSGGGTQWFIADLDNTDTITINDEEYSQVVLASEASPVSFFVLSADDLNNIVGVIEKYLDVEDQIYEPAMSINFMPVSPIYNGLDQTVLYPTNSFTACFVSPADGGVEVALIPNNAEFAPGNPK